MLVLFVLLNMRARSGKTNFLKIFHLPLKRNPGYDPLYRGNPEIAPSGKGAVRDGVVIFFGTAYIFIGALRNHPGFGPAQGERIMEERTAQSREASGGAGFEDIRAMFQDHARYVKEMDQRIERLNAEAIRRHEELDRLVKETARCVRETTQSIKATDQQIARTDQQIARTDQQIARTDRQIARTGKQIGDLGDRLGEIVEHLMSPKLYKKFAALGFRFNHSSRNHELEDHHGKSLTEIDVLLENGEYAMAVEVKTRLRMEDVRDHLKRMEILRQVADEHGDRRKYLGAVAGAVVPKAVLQYALKKGFYVIIPSGETVDIEVPEGQPRIWTFD
jgi:hypothetical protein